jgi:hypothetical protein
MANGQWRTIRMNVVPAGAAQFLLMRVSLNGSH